MSTIIIDEPEPTSVGYRAVSGDVLIFDEPLSSYLTEDRQFSILVFDGEMEVETIETVTGEQDYLIFDPSVTTEMVHTGEETDFLVITTDGPAGPKGAASTVPGPQGPPTFPYVQPDEPLGVPEGTLWLDTDDPTGTQVVKGPAGPVGVVKVEHGSNPDVPRPDAPIVYWVGTVQPVNAHPDDLLMLVGMSVGLVKVNHGADPNMLRPDAPLVYWVGTVQPINADPDDLLLLKET